MQGKLIKSVLFGVAVGDAVGVPFEFNSRIYMDRKPAKDMVGFGTYNQAPGTFSDDSSLTFCLAEALTSPLDMKELANNFINWSEEGFWSARGDVFDIGIATEEAIGNLIDGVLPHLSGGDDEYSNGNGSLMRIAPLLFYIADKQIEERFEITQQVSSITHRHIRSVIACFYYLEFAKQLMEGRSKFEAYQITKDVVKSHLGLISAPVNEISHFDRLLNQDIYIESKDSIKSSGYVIHTLEASIWCLLNTDSYETAILQAVNLGEDTDTTAAVTGGLAGLLYGFEGIPENWINQLAKKNEIEDLAVRLGMGLGSLN